MGIPRYKTSWWLSPLRTKQRVREAARYIERLLTGSLETEGRIRPVIFVGLRAWTWSICKLSELGGSNSTSAQRPWRSGHLRHAASPLRRPPNIHARCWRERRRAKEKVESIKDGAEGRPGLSTRPSSTSHAVLKIPVRLTDARPGIPCPLLPGLLPDLPRRRRSRTVSTA